VYGSRERRILLVSLYQGNLPSTSIVKDSSRIPLSSGQHFTAMSTKNGPVSYDINLPYTSPVDGLNHSTTKYPNYLPTWPKIWFDPLPPFEFQDPALRVVDKSLPNFLPPATKISHIQPNIGSVVEGVQLNTLSNAAKDELAYFIAQRKVAVFPNQDLMDAGPAQQHEFMEYFGKLNYQPVSGSISGYPGFHIIHRDGNKDEIAKFLDQKTTTTLWHQDVSYEIQPPGYVMLGLLEGPEVGGDTVFAATDAAYKYSNPDNEYTESSANILAGDSHLLSALCWTLFMRSIRPPK